MAERRIVWTRVADIQLVGVLEYWNTRNKSSAYSKKLMRAVIKVTDQIANSPNLFRAADFEDARVATVRKNFSLFYRVEEDSIIVLAFWDNRQDPKELLNILKRRS